LDRRARRWGRPACAARSRAVGRRSALGARAQCQR
jgi:hypothetical protein